MYKLATVLTGLFLIIGCNSDQTNDASAGNNNGFSFSKKKAGIDFENRIAETEDVHHFLWSSIYNGGGVAVGDLNNDGLQDIYFCSTFEDDHIYLNKGGLQFENITAASGINKTTHVSSGVVMVDINKDGFLDIYISKFGYTTNDLERANELYINNGDLTFTESAAQYGIANTGYTVQSTFLDYNKDGFLDLYVMNQPSNARPVRAAYSAPGAIDATFLNNNTSDCIYVNNKNGTFSNVSVSAGIRNFAYGLSVVATDINEDGWTDIFVANDYERPDFLYINNKNGAFSEVAGSNFDHLSNFSMGADIEDLNNDLLPDIGVLDMAGANHYRSKTNMPSMSPKTFWANVDKGYHHQYMHNAMHINQGSARFTEQSYMLGVAKTDWSWSILINDFNNDSYEDIFITNGIYRDIRNSDYIDKTIEDLKSSGEGLSNVLEIVKSIPSSPMSNYMFINDGNTHFDNKASSIGLGLPGFSNGAAYADLDNDGDLDLIVNNVNSKADIYENNASEYGNSLRISFSSNKYHRPVLNSKATVFAGGLIKRKELLSARGFMSGPEAILHFGLGELTSVDSVVITWPDNNESVHTDLKLNTLNVIDQDETVKTRRFEPKPKQEGEYFSEMLNLNRIMKHSENEYNAFENQVLLPYQPSELGPYMSSGDINGDGLDDIVIGGSVGNGTSILTQTKNGSFTLNPIKGNENYEDMDVNLFDADNDGDLDLFICSGGYQYRDGTPGLADRMHLNDGNGNFTQINLDAPLLNTGKSIAFDYDQDGDKDLMVFGRVISGSYPIAPHSYLLENNGEGNFVDVTGSNAFFLNNFGMVTDVSLINYKNSEAVIVIGEWMSPKIIAIENNTLTVIDIAPELTGLWFGVESGDLDGDGDDDIVLGNIGKNIKFKATEEKPFKVYASDFDKNGKSDIVLASYYNNKEVPSRGKECSSEQVPELLTKFTTYEGFANASLDEVYDLSGAKSLFANTLESGILWNDEGSWRFEALPKEAQVSPINAIEIIDLDGDGQKDLVICGNLYSMEVETTRLDAGKGLVLIQHDKTFVPQPPYLSGLYAKGDAKDMVRLKIGEKDAIGISMNNDFLRFFEVKK